MWMPGRAVRELPFLKILRNSLAFPKTLRRGQGLPELGYPVLVLEEWAAVPYDRRSKQGHRIFLRDFDPLFEVHS